MSNCVWCLRACPESTLLHGIPYHWVCLKDRREVLKGRSSGVRRRARSARGRAEQIVEQPRRSLEQEHRTTVDEGVTRLNCDGHRP